MIALLLAIAVQCPDGSPPPCRGVVRAPAANSVAVLYFENRSGDSSDSYLADGVTEEVISRLSGIERLSVRSRHMVRRYRGATPDPGAIGRALGVTYLVTGSVRRAGERLRVSAELIRASNGEQVWGRQFDQSGSDVFAIQEEVARDVATGIVGRLVATEQRAIAARPTRHPAAHDAFLRGNFYFNRRDSLGFARAAQQYQAALRLDPQFYDAMARLSMVYAFSESNGFLLMSRDSLIAAATAPAEAAVRGAPSSPEAWMALAGARQLRDPINLAPTIEANRRAVQLDPTNAEAHHQLGNNLTSMMQRDSGLVHVTRALELEPARPITLINMAEFAMYEGRWADAERWLDSALSIDGDFAIGHALMLPLALLRHDTAAARRVVTAWGSQPSLRSGTEWATTLLNLRGADTTALVRFRAVSFPPDGQFMPSVVGCVVASLFLNGLNDREGALMALERSRRSGQLASMMSGAQFAAIARDPRYLRVLRESQP